MAETSVYQMERLNADNLNDLVTLHTAVYGRTLSLDFFQKKYDTAYTGVAYTGFIAYHAQLPIAYYGVIPCLMSCDNQVVLAAQSADTMTHPDYRKKKLFVNLAEQTFELCRDAGIRIIFGFPNQNSLPGFIHQLNWQTTGAMDCFVIPVRAVPLEKLSLKFPFLKGLYASYRQWILKKYIVDQQEGIGSVLADGYDGLLRNNHYLMYKKYTNSQLISIAGTVFWIKISNGMLIGDAAITADAFDKVMPVLTKLAARLGLKQLQFHTSTNTSLHALFAARYQAIPSFPVIFKIIGASLPIAQIKFTFADIDIF